MRVVNLVTQMEAGGAQGAAMRMAAELDRRGYIAETWFLYLKRPTYVGQKNVRVQLPHPPSWIVDYIRIFIALIRELRTFKPDAVITYTHYANILGQIGALMVGVPIRVASQRNPSWTYPKLARFLDWVIGSIGVYTANIAVSHAVRESFKNYPRPYVKRLRIIYNGVSLKESSLRPSEARQKFVLPPHCPLVIHVGRLAWQKNQSILLETLAFLPAVHLAIAGDGELRETLVKRAQDCGVDDRVHFLGEIAPENIPDLLKAGDAFVLPSRFEAFSFALVEAMHAGLPVVASDIPALKEVMGNAEGKSAGLLIQPDAQAWAEAIRQILQEVSLRQLLSSQARQRAALFDLESMVDGYERCLTSSSR